MFLQLGHTKLDVYGITRNFVTECYKVAEKFPAEERYALTSQVRRAAISTHLNLAEGCSRKSVLERVRFFEISRGSVIEVDAALDIAIDLKYISAESINMLGISLVDCYKYLSALINNTH